MAQLGGGKLNPFPCTPEDEQYNLSILTQFIDATNTALEGGVVDSGKVYVSSGDYTTGEMNYLYNKITTHATRDTSADPLIAAAIAGTGGVETLTLFLDSSDVTGYSGTGVWALCVDNGTVKWYDTSGWGGGGGGTDILVKVSGTDTTSEYLHTSMKDQAVFASATEDMVISAAIADATANEKLRLFLDASVQTGYSDTGVRFWGMIDNEWQFFEINDVNEPYRALRGTWVSGTSTLTIDALEMLDSGGDPRTDPNDELEQLEVQNIPGDTYTTGDVVYADYNHIEGHWEARPKVHPPANLCIVARVTTEIGAATDEWPENWGQGAGLLYDFLTGRVSAEEVDIYSMLPYPILTDAWVKLDLVYVGDTFDESVYLVNNATCYEYPWHAEA